MEKLEIIKRLHNIVDDMTLGFFEIARSDANNLLRELYNDEQAEQHKKFLCGNEYRNKEKRCLKQCGNCQGNV